jgi:hypothetical protein
MRSLAGILMLCVLTAAVAFAAQGTFKAGDRVEVDTIMAGAPERARWEQGIVVRVESGLYIVKLASGLEYSVPVGDRWIRPATGVTVDAPAAPAPQEPVVDPGPSITRFKGGDRVEADSTMTGQRFRKGTVVAVDPVSRVYTVDFDNPKQTERLNIIMTDPEKYIRAAQGAAPPKIGFPANAVRKPLKPVAHKACPRDAAHYRAMFLERRAWDFEQQGYADVRFVIETFRLGPPVTKVAQRATGVIVKTDPVKARYKVYALKKFQDGGTKMNIFTFNSDVFFYLERDKRCAFFIEGNVPLKVE